MLVTGTSPSATSAEISGAVQRWVVEFDGPSHFLARGSPNGATLLKRRHLQQLGYTLVVVPYWEWNRVQGREASEVQYLRGKLNLAFAGAGQAAHPAPSLLVAQVQMPLTCPSPASHAEAVRHDADGDHGTSAGGENSAVGGIGKACSLCQEIKPESAFSRKQWAARAHRRRCNQCVEAGTSSSAGVSEQAPKPHETKPLATPAVAAHVNASSDPSSSSHTSLSLSLVTALLVVASAIVYALVWT